MRSARAARTCIAGLACLLLAVGAAAPTPARSAGAARRAALLSALSTAQLAGQRIVYAYSGLTPPAALLARIRAGEAAGVILFGSNISSPRQIRAVVDSLQRANASSPVHVPLLIMTDQEGGAVRRLPGAPSLSERSIGRAASGATLAAAAGTDAAADLAGAGVNANLAPVLDVGREPGNFIDRFGRSYGSDPALVSRLAAAFVAAQQRSGVAATAKHFPGLGAATRSQDTDLRPTTLRMGRAELRSVDELPYAASIAAGVKLVMVSWAIYPALDGRLPAGLSAAVIGGELRDRMGFRGVTITDGLGAGALRAFGGIGARSVRAAAAGADLLLCSAVISARNSPSDGGAALDALSDALAHHRLSRTLAEQAAARVLALRSTL